MKESIPITPQSPTATRQIRQRIAERLSHERPDLIQALSRAQLQKIAEQACDNALEFEIFDEESTYRFLKLWFLPADLLQSPPIQGALFRVLNNTTISASGRMDFIESQVLRRARHA